jgi:hypothetical protein
MGRAFFRYAALIAKAQIQELRCVFVVKSHFYYTRIWRESLAGAMGCREGIGAGRLSGFCKPDPYRAGGRTRMLRNSLAENIAFWYRVIRV